jgi:hypothetical protein
MLIGDIPQSDYVSGVISTTVGVDFLVDPCRVCNDLAMWVVLSIRHASIEDQPGSIDSISQAVA